MSKEKYLKDTQLIVQELLNKKYKFFDQAKAENIEFTRNIPGIAYIERTGPEE
jgi:hypothetical protein